jgi:hypothetical protein
MKHICIYCNYETDRKENYDRHINSIKHKKHHSDNIKNNNITNISDTSGNSMIIVKIDNLTKQNEVVLKQNDELKKKIEHLERVNNENTNKIVKEARVIKKSILSVLNSDFKDTPSIDYIDEKEFRIQFEEEYNLKFDDKDNRLFMRIFSDFKKRKLIMSICNVIVRIIKKEDQKHQSVFNIDASRGNYATKIQDIWHNDKKGLQLKKYTIDVVTKYMLNIMDIYRMKLLDMYNENKIKKDINITDFIMEKQGILLDVNAFLTNPHTHKRIILNMCPDLRIDDKFLE